MTWLKPNKRSPSTVRSNKPKRLTGLSQKARSQVGSCKLAQRERRTAGVESEPKSSTRIVVEHGNTARSPGSRRADLTASRVKSRSTERTEEANAGV